MEEKTFQKYSKMVKFLCCLLSLNKLIPVTKKIKKLKLGRKNTYMHSHIWSSVSDLCNMLHISLMGVYYCLKEEMIKSQK